MAFKFTDNSDYTFPDDISELSELSINTELKNNTNNNSNLIDIIPIYRQLIDAELSSIEKKILNYTEKYEYNNNSYKSKLNIFFKPGRRIYMRCCVINGNKVNKMNKIYGKIISLHSGNEFFGLYIIELEDSKKRYISNNLLFVIDDITILEQYNSYIKTISFGERYNKMNITPLETSKNKEDNHILKSSVIDDNESVFSNLSNLSSISSLSGRIPNNVISSISSSITDRISIYKHSVDDNKKLCEYIDINYKIALETGHEDFEYTIKKLLKKIYNEKIKVKHLEHIISDIQNKINSNSNSNSNSNMTSNI